MAALGNIVVLDELDIVPTEDEVAEYGEFLGIDLELERDLLWVAREGMTERLPEGWRACAHRDRREDIFYWHAGSRKSTWEHPNDAIYREKVHVARDERRLVVLTLTWKKHGTDSEVVATTIAGTELSVLSAKESDSFGDFEEALRKSIAVEEGAVMCFVKPDASMIGFSARAKSVGEVLQ